MTDSMSMRRGAAAPAGWLEGLRKRALVLAVAAGAVSVVGAVLAPEHFFRAYLTGFLFWVGVPLGCLALLMLTHMTGGSWALVARRIFEAASRTLPLLAALFVPVILGLGTLYSWSRPDVVAASELLQAKAAYLNTRFFLARAAVFFLVWGMFALLLSQWSLRQDRGDQPALHRRLQGLSGAGLLVYMLTASFASFDWLMSLDPTWISSLYGMHFVVGQGATGLCWLIILARWLARSEPLARVYAGRHFDDYGKLLLAFILLWAYMTYSQFVIIWSANLPEEIGWYLPRRRGGFYALSFAIFALYFVLPFFLLLSKSVRSNPRRLAWVAVSVFIGRWLDLVWQVGPSLEPDGPVFHWLDPVVLVAIGGIWVAAFAWELKRRSLLPQHDPNLEEALADG